jgi:hypothetical protein
MLIRWSVRNFGRHHQQFPEAGEKHAGGDQHHHGQRNLSGHQNIAAECAPLVRSTVPARFQRAYEIRPCGLPGRSQAEKDTAHQRCQQAELDDPPIQLYAQYRRWIPGHAERLQQPDSAIGYQ